MSIYGCPHCGTVAVVTGDADDNCPKIGCRAVMERLDEPEATRAVYGAYYGHDHGFTPSSSVRRNLNAEIDAQRQVNHSLERLAKTVEEL